MAKIFLPSVNEFREINQIVSFGCSMTAGEEIMDKVRKEYKPVSKKVEEALVQTELKQAWPSQLASLYGIPSYNLAESGSSFEKQIIQFIYAKERNLITTDTLVLWGLTSNARGVFFDDEIPNVLSYMLNNYNDLRIIKENKDIKYFWYNRLNNDQHLYWKYYGCLQNMFHIANQFCNNQLLFVQGHEVSLRFQTPTVGNAYNKMIDQYWEMLEPEYNRYSIFKQGEPHECIASWAFNNNMTHRNFHPTVEGHIEYAKLIKERLDSYNE